MTILRIDLLNNCPVHYTAVLTLVLMLCVTSLELTL